MDWENTEEKVATAKRLIDSVLNEFGLKITVDEKNGDPVLHDCETWHEVNI